MLVGRERRASVLRSTVYGIRYVMLRRDDVKKRRCMNSEMYTSFRCLFYRRLCIFPPLSNNVMQYVRGYHLVAHLNAELHEIFGSPP